MRGETAVRTRRGSGRPAKYRSKMRVGSSFVSIAIALLCSCQFGLAEPQTTGSLLGDARIIITSEKNDVRLWAHPPRLLVFGDARAQQAVTDIVQTIEDAIESPFGPEFFGEIVFEDLPENLGHGQEPLSIRIREGGPSGWNIHVDLGDGVVWQTDILVVVADRPALAMINGLWGMSQTDNRFMLQGGISRCFYAVRSRDGIRYGSLVSIFPEPTFERAQECLWEEILHALGPLQDAEGTSYFSFDDQSLFLIEMPANDRINLERYKRENDLLLLRALYESGVKPGDPPDVVLQYLENLTEER